MALSFDQRVVIRNPGGTYDGKFGWVTIPSVARGKYTMVLIDGSYEARRFSSKVVFDAATTVATLPDVSLYPPTYPSD
jgi:hypothetical protein